jgi:alpha-L-fucosidase 2
MKKLLILMMLLPAVMICRSQNSELKLWYRTPANFFEESLPIGNGRLGACIYGNADHDMLQLNDITLWSGNRTDNNQNKDAYKYIPEIRDALFHEDYRAADSLQHFVQGHNSAYYQPLATINISDNTEGQVLDYYRELNISDGTAMVSYNRGGISYYRTYFASHPDNAIVIHLTASRDKSINCEISLSSLLPHGLKTNNDQIILTGHSALSDPDSCIHFCSILTTNIRDGKLEKNDSVLKLSGVSEATIYFVNETSFNGFDKNPVSQGRDYLNLAEDDVWHLHNYKYTEIKQRHLTDYQKLFNRLILNLDSTKYDYGRTTDEQLRDYTDKAENNHYLETLYFQYGRYLLISSSRTPGVPPELQGLWNKTITPPWRGNYTMNINLEENYWPVEVANLPEMIMPLNDFVKALSVNGSFVAKHFYNIHEGWCACHNSDIWAMANPVGDGHDSPQWANWNLGGAWLVNTLWEHYDFTCDKNYLQNTAYPLMKGAADFCMSWLIENPKKRGELITAPSTSPENTYINDDGYNGCTMYGGTADMAIIRECLSNTMKAAKILNIDKDFQQRLSQTISRLRPYQIGKGGNLQEWYYDWKDRDPRHRHQSHLIGLYPGHQITLSDTPDLAQAAAKTLEIKGIHTTGWSTGWRINLWARLHNADMSYKLFRQLLNYVSPDDYKGADRRHNGGTYPNLFDAHPPFQIDGNFGGTAGVCEMLLQSGDGTIELLPSLPTSWPKGKIVGLCARGGYTVDMTWSKGLVTSATIHSKKDGKISLTYNGKHVIVTFKAGETKRITM